ncbi:MAG: PfkB family carbohydrate kinase [archaeon]
MFSFFFIIVDKNTNSRTILHRSGPSYDEILDFSERVVENVDLVFLDGRFHNSALKLAKYAHAKNIPVFVDAEKEEHFVQDLFPYANIIKTSKRFSQSFYKSNNIEKNLRKIISTGAVAAITTLGQDGSILLTHEGLSKFDAASCNSIDTTGAGDVFNAGIIFGYLNKWKWNDTMNFASKISSIKCESFGARKGQPYLKDMREYFVKYKLKI